MLDEKVFAPETRSRVTLVSADVDEERALQ
jgi:hypothetical protein